MRHPVRLDDLQLLFTPRCSERSPPHRDLHTHQYWSRLMWLSPLSTPISRHRLLPERKPSVRSRAAHRRKHVPATLLQRPQVVMHATAAGRAASPARVRDPSARQVSRPAAAHQLGEGIKAAMVLMDRSRGTQLRLFGLAHGFL
ncbi:hypothetical protein HK405_013247, partial [Cladochytrium tenue]